MHDLLYPITIPLFTSVYGHEDASVTVYAIRAFTKTASPEQPRAGGSFVNAHQSTKLPPAYKQSFHWKARAPGTQGDARRRLTNSVCYARFLTCRKVMPTPHCDALHKLAQQNYVQLPIVLLPSRLRRCCCCCFMLLYVTTAKQLGA